MYLIRFAVDNFMLISLSQKPFSCCLSVFVFKKIDYTRNTFCGTRYLSHCHAI